MICKMKKNSTFIKFNRMSCHFLDLFRILQESLSLSVLGPSESFFEAIEPFSFVSKKENLHHHEPN